MVLTFRRMVDDDLGMLVRWRRESHVLAWFRDAPADLADARARYGRRLSAEEPVRMWVAEHDGDAIGYVQDYAVDVDDDLAVRVQLPGAVAFDYLIGEPELIGQGLGTQMLASFLRTVLLPDHPSAPWFVASPDAHNTASLRVLDKLGFSRGQWIQPPGEEYAEIVCRISRQDAEAITLGSDG